MLGVVEPYLDVFIHHCKDFDDVIFFPRVGVVENIVVGQIEPLDVSVPLFHHTVSRWLRFVVLEEETLVLYGFRTTALQWEVWKDDVIFCDTEVMDHFW